MRDMNTILKEYIGNLIVRIAELEAKNEELQYQCALMEHKVGSNSNLNLVSKE